jgi:hypothetical protein
MKIGPDPPTPGTAKNESGSVKHENGTRRPPLPPKTSPGAQNMKIGPDASVPLKTSPGAENMKVGPDVLDSAEN